MQDVVDVVVMRDLMKMVSRNKLKRDLNKTGDPLDEQLQKTPKMTVPSSGGEPQAQSSERNDEKEHTTVEQTDAVV